jgi:hypothetical protein
VKKAASLICDFFHKRNCSSLSEIPEGMLFCGSGWVGRRDEEAYQPGLGLALKQHQELKVCFDARPHLCPLPRGEDFAGTFSGLRKIAQRIQSSGSQGVKTG